MSQAIATSIAAAIGTDHVRTDVGGRVVVTPPSTEALAHLLGLAYDGSWSVTIAGNGSWQVNDAPTTITISLRALDQVVEFDPTPTGYVAAQGGASLEAIRRHVANRPRRPHALTIEPPGRTDRSVGSVVATGALGAMRAGEGQLVDELRGLVVVTGDGRIVRIESHWTEHKATVERMRPHVGGLGAFGVIAEVRLKTRELPQVDHTTIATGDRDTLVAVARAAWDRGVPAVAMELLSPALSAQPDWTIAIRIQNKDDIWRPMIATLLEPFLGLTITNLDPNGASALWTGASHALTAAPVTLRLGATFIGIEETLDLVLETLGEGMLSCSVQLGVVRWSGEAGADTLRSLRTVLAAREIPLTIERAPWSIRNPLGQLGTYHEDVGSGLIRLREAWDPRGVLNPAALPPDARR